MFGLLSVDFQIRAIAEAELYLARKVGQDDGENGLHIYVVTPDTMGRKYRGLYDDLNLKAVRTADGLEITWGFGQESSKKCASPRCKASATTS